MLHTSGFVMTSCFYAMGPVGQNQAQCYVRRSLPGGGTSWRLDNDRIWSSSLEYGTGGEVRCLRFTCYYICQVNGVKLADILFSLLCVCVCVCVCVRARTQSSFQQFCSSHRLKAIKLYKSCKKFTWRICALSSAF